jgi:hypothetical protein
MLVIVGLSVYFMTLNKKINAANAANAAKEHFIDNSTANVTSMTQDPTPQQIISAPNTAKLSDNSDATNSQIIQSIYMDLFKQAPTKEEIQFYLDYIKAHPDITTQQLIDIIASSAPILRKTIPESSFLTNTKYGTEDQTILGFNIVLSRNPTDTELQQYAKMMSDDKTFTMEKLIQVLVSTDEYDRLEKMQLNNYNAGLLGGATDRQISMTVDAAYTDIVGKQIDSDTMTFLKKKFISFNLDETKLRQFITDYVTDNPYTQTCQEQGNNYPLVIQEEIQNAINTSSQTSITTSQPAHLSQIPTSTITGEMPSSSAIYNNSQVYNVYVPNQEILNSLTQSMQSGQDTSGNYLSSQSVLDTINSKANNNYNTSCLVKQKDETLLSNEINNRNMEELGSACARNTAFMNADSDYILRPDQKWTVPEKRTPVCNPSSKCQVVDSTDQTSLIGTPLADSKKTSVGSILPYLPPR